MVPKILPSSTPASIENKEDCCTSNDNSERAVAEVTGGPAMERPTMPDVDAS